MVRTSGIATTTTTTGRWRHRQSGEDGIKHGLRTIGIPFLEFAEAHRYVATVGRVGTASSFGASHYRGTVSMIHHQPNFHAGKRLDHELQCASHHLQHRKAAPAFREHTCLDEKITLAISTNRATQVRPVIQAEHDHWLAGFRYVPGVDIDLRVVCPRGCRRSGNGHQACRSECVENGAHVHIACLSAVNSMSIARARPRTHRRGPHGRPYRRIGRGL